MATIRKRGDSYQIRASAGYGYNGRQIVKSLTWTPAEGLTQRQIEKELNRIAIDFERQVESGLCVDSKTRFSDYAAMWLQKGEDGGEKPIAPKTLERYKTLLRRINTAMGHIRLCDIQPHHIREFLNNLKEEGIREDSTYTADIDLLQRLKEKKISQKTLATDCGLSITTIRSACNGRGISAASAEKICKSQKLNIKQTFNVNAVNNDRLSDRTLLHYYRLISAILNGAVIDDQAILSNPAKRVRPPHCKQVEAPYLDEVQAAQMIELLNKEPIQYRTMVLLLLYTGIRRGELCGLEWKDIDFNNRTLSIKRTSQYTPDKGIFVKGTKTASGVRTMKLPVIAVDLLRKYRAWQIERRFSLGDLWEEHDRLYTSWNGRPAHPDTLTGWFGSFIKRTDLPPIHIHSLRHTNASLLIAGGEDIRTVSRRLGHTQVSTTANIYTHAIQSADARAAETLENILNPIKKRA